MTRLAGYSGLGGHPELPEQPEYLSDAPITRGLTSAGAIALSVTAATSIFKRDFITPAVRRASYLSLVTVPAYFFAPRLRRRELERRGEKVVSKEKPIVQNLGKKLEYDDFAIGGAILGLVAAVNPRLQSCRTQGWRRYAGLATLGCCATTVSARWLYPPSKQAQAKPVFFKRMPEGGMAISFPGFSIGMNSSVQAGAQQGSAESPNEDDESASMQASLQIPEPDIRSDNKPHLVRFTENGSREFVPMADHSWDTQDPSKALAMVDQYIKTLKKDAKTSELVANYLWIALSAKEMEFYATDDAGRQQELKDDMRSLGTMHLSCFREMATTSWMVADTLKRAQQIRQLKPDESRNTTATKKRLAKVHEDVIASVCADQKARIRSAEAAVEWTSDGVRRAQTLYDHNFKALTEQLRQHLQSTHPVDLDLSNNKADAVLKQQVAEFFEEAGMDHPLTRTLVEIKKAAYEAREELDRLREEQSNEKD